MDLFVDDDLFIRAPAALVYPRLVDLSRYPAWWIDLAIVRAAPAGATWDAEMRAPGAAAPGPLTGAPRDPGDAVLVARLGLGRFRRALRVELRPYRFRPDKGLVLALAGDLEGTGEWWLEEGWGGTVVHHIARLDVRRGSRRTAGRYRASVRRAGWNLKDAVQSEVRRLAGYPA